MNKIKTTSLLVALMTTALLSACSKDGGFQPLTEGTSNQGSNSGQGGGDTNTPKPPAPMTNWK